jgi:catechol 2,3-dioxygenase-like lactoylglutathione lyase family enzyme
MPDRPSFMQIAPILPVSNVEAALRHYGSLGFRTRPYDQGSDYGFVERGRVALHLTYRPTSYYAADGIAVAYLFVEDADQLYARWTGPGIGGRTEAPADMPWQMREGVHVDPDGNVIRFGSPLG